ncbi:MAG: SIR2 family NAD-dependent protein deacylase [Paracoccaceae bacterium]
MRTLYITGAGVSSDSGIPTFRGADGFWTIGSENYTPQEMATRHMYLNNPEQFLLWYFNRFAKYRNAEPNDVHRWLADKNLITQNIDGLDGKAGNNSYIPIHGRLDKVTVFAEEGEDTLVVDAPWDKISGFENTYQNDADTDKSLIKTLIECFKIKKDNQERYSPILGYSLKPFVLLFDEIYTDLYKISEAQKRMMDANKMVFMGTSFSVNITAMALRIAATNLIDIEIIDPNPIDVRYKHATYFEMSALEYVESLL